MSARVSRRRGRRWLVAGCGSIALHAALFLVAGYAARQARHAAPAWRPIEIAVLVPALDPPTVVPSPVKPPRSEPSVKAASSRPALAAPSAPSTGEGSGRDPSSLGESTAASEPSVAPGGGLAPAGPRRLTLYPAGALSGWRKAEPAVGASGGGEVGERPAPAEEAQARIAAWVDAYKGEQLARVGGATGNLGALRDRVELEFRPDPRSLRDAGTFGIGALSAAQGHLDSVQRWRGGMTPSAGPTTGRLRDGRMFPQQDELSLALPIGGSRVNACFGDCGPQSHLVAALSVTIRILHDEEGRPRDREVVDSSGDSRFDNQALAAVDLAAAGLGVEALRAPPLPVMSAWELSAKAYRWGRADLMLDPLFIPPGEVVESSSGFLGKTTMVREVRLVAVAYAKPSGG